MCVFADLCGQHFATYFSELIYQRIRDVITGLFVNDVLLQPEQGKEALNKISDEEKIPDIWRKRILIPIFENYRGDMMNCGNYRCIKLMCHSMKLYERVHDDRLRRIVSISDEQFGFVKGKSTTDAMFALRQLLVLSYVYSQQPIFGLTQEWFRELSFSRLECGVHDKIHMSSADWWDLLLPLA